MDTKVTGGLLYFVVLVGCSIFLGAYSAQALGFTKFIGGIVGGLCGALCFISGYIAKEWRAVKASLKSALGTLRWEDVVRVVIGVITAIIVVFARVLYCSILTSGVMMSAVVILWSSDSAGFLSTFESPSFSALVGGLMTVSLMMGSLLSPSLYSNKKTMQGLLYLSPPGLVVLAVKLFWKLIVGLHTFWRWVGTDDYKKSRDEGKQLAQRFGVELAKRIDTHRFQTGLLITIVCAASGGYFGDGTLWAPTFFACCGMVASVATAFFAHVVVERQQAGC